MVADEEFSEHEGGGDYGRNPGLLDDDEVRASTGVGHQHSMPDQLRISDFVQRVKRLRYFSQCLPVSSHANQGGSPGSGSSIGTVVDSNSSFTGSGQAVPPPQSTVRFRRKRSNSCPNLLQMDDAQDQSSVPSSGLMSKDEPGTPSAASTHRQQSDAVCQTDTDLWPPTPYEHLFFSILPPSLLFPPPPAPVEAHARPLAPSELLDRYIDDAFRNHERSTALLGKPNATEDVALLKGESPSNY